MRSPALACALLVLARPAAAAADDFFDIPPFLQATAAFEQGDLGQAEMLTLPLAQGEAATAEACALLGQIRQAQQRWPESVEAFERAVAKKAGSAQLRSRLGTVLLDQAEATGAAEREPLLQRARRELERAEALDPACVDAQFALLRHQLLVPEAEPTGAADRRAERVIELDPLDFAYDVAALAERLERYDLAARYYTLVDEQFPGSPWLQMKRAAMLGRLGRVAEARSRLEAILRRVPDFKPAAMELAKLPAS